MVHLHRARVAVEFSSTLAKSLITLALVQLGSSSSGSSGSGSAGVTAPGQLLAKALGVLGVRGGGAGGGGGLPPALVFSVAQLSLSLVVLVGYGAVGLRLLRQGRRQQQVRGPTAAGTAAVEAQSRGQRCWLGTGTGSVTGQVGRRGGSASSEAFRKLLAPVQMVPCLMGQSRTPWSRPSWAVCSPTRATSEQSLHLAPMPTYLTAFQAP